MKLRKLFTAFALAIGFTATAATPVVGWKGDFSETPRNGFTLNLNDATVSDGCYPVGSGKGLSIDELPSSSRSANNQITVISRVKDVPNGAGVMVAARNQNDSGTRYDMYQEKAVSSGTTAVFTPKYGNGSTGNWGQKGTAIDVSGEVSFAYMHDPRKVSNVNQGTGFWVNGVLAE